MKIITTIATAITLSYASCSSAHPGTDGTGLHLLASPFYNHPHGIEWIVAAALLIFVAAFIRRSAKRHSTLANPS